MKKLIFKIGFCLFLFVAVYLQDINCNANLWSINSGTGLSQLNSISKIINPVFLADSAENFATVLYSPSKMGMKELSTNAVIFGKRIFKNTHSALSYIGNPSDLYNEFSISFSASQSFDDVGILAASINYSAISIEKYSNNSKISVDLAGKIKIADYLYSGFLIRNLNRAYYIEDKFINQEVYVGFGFLPFNGFSIDIDAIININDRTGMSLGGAYQFGDFMKLRTAYKTTPEILEAGLEVNALDFLNIVLLTDYNKFFGYYYMFGLGLKF